MEKIIVENEHKVSEVLANEIEKLANTAIEENGVFHVGLSGGSLVKYLCVGLPTIKTDWSKWLLYFCDERFVPETDNDSTYGTYLKELVPKTSLKDEQFVKINLELSLADCASEYEQKILDKFKVNKTTIPRFDLLLLGMGPDGHICSLFPGHALLKEETMLIAPIDDSPKPPPKRITMTFPLINNARCCIFAISGAGKANMTKELFSDNKDLPARMVSPKNGVVKCIIDKEAGKFL